MLHVALALVFVASVGETVDPRYAAQYDADAGFDANASFAPFAGYDPEAGYDEDALYHPHDLFDPEAGFEPMASLVRADLVAKAAEDEHGIPVARDVRIVLLGVGSWFDALEPTSEPIEVRPPRSESFEGDAEAEADGDARGNGPLSRANAGPGPHEAGKAGPRPTRADRALHHAEQHLRQRYAALAEVVEREDGGDARGALLAKRRAAHHATWAARALGEASTLDARDGSRPQLERIDGLAGIGRELDAVRAALGA